MIGIRLAALAMYVRDVMDAARRGSQKAARKAGEELADTARGNIQAGDQPSLPGQPPRSPTGVFPASIGVEDTGEGVIVGPALLSSNGQMRDATPFPALLEAGGVQQVTEVFMNGRWVAARGPVAGLKTRTRSRRMEARPVMGPSLAEVGPRLPGFWVDSVTA
jgi:hypothetical protein